MPRLSFARAACFHPNVDQLRPGEDTMPQKPEVAGFFDERTCSVQYVVADPATRRCAIIDPVLDFEEKSGATATHNADRLLGHIGRERLEPVWILDTHPHADHFSAAHYLKQKTGAPTAIGEKIVEVQRLWKILYDWPDLPADGSQWDRLFADGEHFAIGELDVAVLFSPGHTLASITYLAGDAAFIHDTLFMPDGGTARADFPGGSSTRLWNSIQAILALPAKTRLFTGHDYRPNSRPPLWESSVAEQKANNIHLCKCRTEAEFAAFRDARDRTLPMPKLILHALQVNINGGRLPEPEPDGRRYLKIPIDALPGAAWD
jgi:glyoxylase-like metal-dependent hydrolase (beta-lactamase superfamily II)